MTETPIESLLSLLIAYDAKAPWKCRITTNIKRELIEDHLVDYIRDVHFGAGVDENAPLSERNDFEISITYDPTTGNWVTRDNCENQGLCCGIILSVLAHLRNGQGEFISKDFLHPPKRTGKPPERIDLTGKIVAVLADEALMIVGLGDPNCEYLPVFDQVEHLYTVCKIMDVTPSRIVQIKDSQEFVKSIPKKSKSGKKLMIAANFRIEDPATQKFRFVMVLPEEV